MGDFSTDGNKPWSGSYAAALAKSNAKCIAAGDEHSNHSDEELIAALPNTYFKPVQYDEEEAPTTIVNDDRPIRQECDVHSLRGTGQDIPTAERPQRSSERRSSRSPNSSSTPSDTRLQLPQKHS